MSDQIVAKQKGGMFAHVLSDGGGIQPTLACRQVISDISQLKHFEIADDLDSINTTGLRDSEKAHPVVVLQDHSLLVVADPNAKENILIRAQRNRLTSSLGVPPEERPVDRVVLRSWIDQHTSSGVVKNRLPSNKDCESILGKVAELNATDIHIDVKGSHCTVRYRANGVFCHATNFTAEVGKLINSAFWETYVGEGIGGDLVKDGRFSRVVNGVEHLFRLSFGSSPKLNIYSTAIRARNMHDIPRLHQLGYCDRQMQLFKEVQGNAGMTLICGSVNSGKSTLQAALMSLRPEDQFNLEVSDQVEVILPHFIQLQKPSGTDENVFEQTQRLYKLPTRHDIDFIAINEIRDRDTALLMQDLMQLGTPGITSIHAKGWAEAINRLHSEKLGVDPSTLFGEGFFNGIAYQTLGRLLCECKQEHHEDVFWDHYFRERLGDSLAFRCPQGCHLCNFTGISGLTAVAEIVPISDANRSLLRDTTNSRAMYRWMHENNVPTIFQHALKKIKAKQIDPQMIRQKLGNFDETNIFDQFKPH